jgi:hypothetical protein
MSVFVKQIGEHERCRAMPIGYEFWFGRHGMERKTKALALCKSGTWKTRMGHEASEDGDHDATIE